ncbi:MAG: hypothetical protein KC636_07305, partial [Myxococcales bacterium]|nr:hypothetical protein [Myxococcales bacterium]
GLIADVGGDLPTKSNKGIVIMAAAGALVFGVALGYMLNNITSKSKLVAQGKEKGAQMYEEASETAKMRASIALAMKDIPQKIAADPKAGAEELKKLSDTNFEKHPKVDALFGRELATIHGNDIKRVFQLYEEANGLKTDLGSLTNFVAANASSLAKEGGPSSFGVLSKEDGITLVEVVQPMCPGEGEDPAPCTPDTVGNAIGYLVRDKLGAEPSFAPTGGGAGQVRPISSGDEMYLYLVGQNPENNAKILYQRMLGNVQTRLEDMNKVERRAIKALAKFSDDPESAGEETAEE